MEQLGIQTGSLIAQIVNFGIIVVVFKYLLLTPIQNLLAQRKQRIEKSLKDADLIEERLKKVEKEIDDRLAQASKQADDIIAQAKLTGEELRAQLKQQAEQESDGLLRKAQTVITRQQEEALEQLEGQVAKLAKGISEKVLAQYLSETDAQKITDRALKEVVTKLQ